MIADHLIDVHKMFKSIVGNGNEDNMETNDDQSSDGDIGNKREFNVIKNFASIEYSEKETDVRRIEEYDVQHMLA